MAVAASTMGIAHTPGAGAPAAAAPSNVTVTGDGVRTYGAPTGINSAPLAMASTASGNGYWIVSTDGGIFSYGDAAFYGSTGNIALNRPVVGMAATPTGHGYWLVASDGGIFAFGDAAFYGSMGDKRLNRPIVGIAASPSGLGYWMVAEDGGMFAFGDAAFKGSTGDMDLNSAIVAMAATRTGNGYWLTAADGGLFAFGDAGFYGSGADRPNDVPWIAITVSADGMGYRLIDSKGFVRSFGSAKPTSTFVVNETAAARRVVAAVSPSAGPTDGLWMVDVTGVNNSECHGDPLGDVRGPRPSSAQIDLVGACLEVRQFEMAVTFELRTPRATAELLSRMRQPETSAGGRDFFVLDLAAGSRGTTYEESIYLLADANGTYAISRNRDGTRNRGVPAQLTVVGNRVTFVFGFAAVQRNLSTVFWEAFALNDNGSALSFDAINSDIYFGPLRRG
jgi:hypothetical protein